MKRLVLAVVLSCSTFALAQTCERPHDSSPSSVAAQSDEARLAFLSKLLLEESGRAYAWRLGWGATYGVLTVVQLGVMQLFTKEEQPDWYWGALSTAVGVAFTLLDPPEVLEAGPRYAQRAKVVPEGERCKLIAEGERLLEQGAAHEQDSVAWYLHAGNILFNVGLGLVLGLGYQRWISGAINMGVGAAIGEATIFTSPTHLISGWQRYRLGESPPAVTFHVIPTAGPGIGVLLTF